MVKRKVPMDKNPSQHLYFNEQLLDPLCLFVIRENVTKKEKPVKQDLVYDVANLKQRPDSS